MPTRAACTSGHRRFRLASGRILGPFRRVATCKTPRRSYSITSPSDSGSGRRWLLQKRRLSRWWLPHCLRAGVEWTAVCTPQIEEGAVQQTLEVEDPRGIRRVRTPGRHTLAVAEGGVREVLDPQGGPRVARPIRPEAEVREAGRRLVVARLPQVAGGRIRRNAARRGRFDLQLRKEQASVADDRRAIPGDVG